jgi:hypothetical protein
VLAAVLAAELTTFKVPGQTFR